MATLADVARHAGVAASTASVDAVLIGVPDDPAGLDCVDLDFAAAGRLCVAHLARLGHRTVAFLGEAEAVYLRHIGFAARTLRGIADAALDLPAASAGAHRQGQHRPLPYVS